MKKTNLTMKQIYLILVFAFTIFAGCKPKSDSGSGNQSGNSESSPQNSSSGSSQQWSTTDKQEFIDACIPDASKALGDGTGKTYCNCVLEKLMKEYPNPKDAGKASGSRMTEYAKECRESTGN